MEKELLKIKNLKVSFYNESSLIQVIRGFDLEINRGELLAILGESGSGKTVSASSIMRLMEDDEGRIDSGSILFEGVDLVKLKEKQLQEIRGKRISYVFQNPSEALNPYKIIGKQLMDTLKIHDLEYSEEIVINALKEVGLSDPETVYNMYPFQLSGGQNQRILIAQCIICKPDLLIADEPTSAIDASLRKKILDLFRDINKKYNMSIILITHDFDVAKYLCNKLIIMYGGLVVEEGNLLEILKEPLHPYTEGLIKCARSLDLNENTLFTLEGTPLTPYEFKDECPFYSRCKIRRKECLEEIPKTEIIGNRKVRCIRERK